MLDGLYSADGAFRALRRPYNFRDSVGIVAQVDVAALYEHHGDVLGGTDDRILRIFVLVEGCL